MSEYKPKRYACMRWPALRMGVTPELKNGIKFNAGFYTTRSQAEQDVIEASEAYGVHVHPILWEPKEVPTKPGKVETLIEAEIEAALASKAPPKARRGAIGTRG